jgi:hypothetical protein
VLQDSTGALCAALGHDIFEVSKCLNFVEKKGMGAGKFQELEGNSSAVSAKEDGVEGGLSGGHTSGIRRGGSKNGVWEGRKASQCHVTEDAMRWK